ANGNYVISVQAVSTTGPQDSSAWVNAVVAVGNDSTPPEVQCFSSQGNCEPVAEDLHCQAGQCTITIHWLTDDLSTSEVEYGLTSAYTSTQRYDRANPADPSPKYTDHAVTLSGLQPDKLYHYRITS